MDQDGKGIGREVGVILGDDTIYVMLENAERAAYRSAVSEVQKAGSEDYYPEDEWRRNWKGSRYFTDEGLEDERDEGAVPKRDVSTCSREDSKAIAAWLERRNAVENRETRSLGCNTCGALASDVEHSSVHHDICSSCLRANRNTPPISPEHEAWRVAERRNSELEEAARQMRSNVESALDERRKLDEAWWAEMTTQTGIDAYQSWTRTKTPSKLETREISSTFLTCLLGLPGEVGELIDLIKKDICHSVPIDRNKLEKELGDVMFYLCALADHYGMPMSEVCETNRKKLEERYPNGFVPGGGNR